MNKSNSVRFVLLFFLLFLVFASRMICFVSAQSETGSGTIYLSPKQSELIAPPTQVGSTFTVTVRIANYTRVAAWEVKLCYNSILLSTSNTSVVYASDYIFPSGSYYSIPPDIEQFNDTYNYVIMMSPTAGLVEYNGSDAGLMSVTFTVLEVPENGNSLSCSLWLEPVDTWMLNTDEAELSETLIDGSYLITDVSETSTSMFPDWVWIVIIVVIVLVAVVIAFLLWKRKSKKV